MENSKSTPKDVFSYLLMVVTLIISIVSFLSLVFQYVNILLEDPLNSYLFGAESAARAATAALIVAWPVFLLMSSMVGRDIKHEPGKREIKIRKWLLYFTLFAAAITIIVSLIVLINNFLNGELTWKFVTKVLAVLLVAVLVFWYYLWDLKRTAERIFSLSKILAWVLSGLILAAVIAQFFIVGTPAEQRARRLDQERVNDLQIIQNQVSDYYSLNSELPENFGQLSYFSTSDDLFNDPEIHEPYEYRKMGTDKFELCAVFSTKSQKSEDFLYPVQFDRSLKVKGQVYENDWRHEQGRTCFERTVMKGENE